MEKRYQVFISSTFQDLQNARQEVSQALLRADCFPAGMELFPAADEEQFEFIKTVIDQSDYYIIISAGRYGTIHPETELSYTEMEYDYAVETSKPVIRLLHKDPFNELKGAFIEKTDKGRGKLKKFREKMMMSKLVNFWMTPEELGANAILGILDTRKRFPTDGWVRGNNALSLEHFQEIEALRKQITENKRKDTETVVGFGDRVGDSDVKIMVAKKDEESKEKKFGTTRIPNKIISKQIFLSLLENELIGHISREVSDVFTETFKFSKAALKWDHYWLELDDETTLNCLLYLESRGLATVNHMQSVVVQTTCSMTAKGRRHAVFIKANRDFD